MTRGVLTFVAVAVACATLTAAAARAETARVMVLGDSFAAGYGLAPEQAFPAQLQAALNAAGFDAQVLDHGVSGDTTAGGLARLDWALADAPTHIIVELGGNDGLRGLDPAFMRANLDAILERLTAEGLPVLVAGMVAPPNLGDDYAAAFNPVFPELAKAYGALLYPFIFDGVAMDPALNQADGIHPNAEGVRRIVTGILPSVIALLERGDQP